MPPERTSRRRLEPSTARRATLLVTLAVAALAACAASADAGEAERIVGVLGLTPGMRVADVGAGNGEWTEAIALAVGSSGHVWATEVVEDEVTAIGERVVDAGLDNVTVVLGDQRSTGLPEGCCDAVLLRLVYHHFTDPAAMRASLARALRPGGRLVIIDIEPQEGWRELPGVPERGGHGIPRSDLVAEMAADGFEVGEEIAEWNGDEDRYCVVFRLAR